ncbi:MAG: hypothetical protein HY518_03405 [Candidatus Aenigmarchaeota archaeon]|nr:hypothetical protein [Candidatus Aenigmarchaeota archaeon]
MKAQMFILSMIFLVGLVFVVYQLLLQYGSINTTEPLENDEVFATNNIRDAFNSTLTSAAGCGEAEQNLQNLDEFIERQQPTGSFIIDNEYTLICSNWANAYPDPPPLNLTISVYGGSVDTRVYYEFYRNQ